MNFNFFYMIIDNLLKRNNFSDSKLGENVFQVRKIITF